MADTTRLEPLDRASGVGEEREPMETKPSGQVINGIDVSGFLESCKAARSNPSLLERRPTVVARWIGGTRAEIKSGDVVSYAGGKGELNPMRMLLGALAACDVDVIATHAAALGVSIEELWVEATGHFNARAYLGLADDPGSGYDAITYTVHLRAPGLTPEQAAALRRRCERGSPVGDSLTRRIPVTLQFETEQKK